MKIRKIKHKFGKFFGFASDKWARGSKWYKQSYGHFSGRSSDRTKAEIQNTIDRDEYANRNNNKMHYLS